MSYFKLFNSERRFLVPEIIQTSSMDCGPATLKSVLNGYNISVSYERLREICQTDVSGTSINNLEDIACFYGLDAQQVIIQNDHLLLSETDALPAIVVVRLPDGYGHFIVVWKTYRSWVQIMDPAIGRMWISQNKLLEMIYPYSQKIDIDIWQEYVKTDDFCEPLKRRMLDLQISPSKIDRLIQDAHNNKLWKSMATLDASVRLLKTISTSGSFISPESSEKILNTYYESAMNNVSEEIIPKEYYCVSPLDNNNDCDKLLIKGALLIHISGKIEKDDVDEDRNEEIGKTIPDDLKNSIYEISDQPEQIFFKNFFLENKIWSLITLIAGIALSSFNVVVEAVILMGFTTIGVEALNGFGQQSISILSIFIFFTALLFIELPVNAVILKVGRIFEISMRKKILEKIPFLGDHYFRSRLNSDMAQRVHDMRLVRKISEIVAVFFRLVFQIIITVAGIMYLMPVKTFIPILAGISAAIIPIAAIPLLKEQDLRFLTFTGSLARFCLDALIGLVPLRSHSAENSIRYEHENILCKWKKSGIEYYLIKLAIIGCGSFINILFSIWMVYLFLLNGGNNTCILLIIYWALNLPELGIQLANYTALYPGVRNRIFRLLEPVNASIKTKISENDFSDHDKDTSQAINLDDIKFKTGIKIDLHDVTVIAGRRNILSDINISINPGEHIAVVGKSGAGKSSLMRLLLGFYNAQKGEIRIDNKIISSNKHIICRETAWIDPCVHIWNKTIADNIKYGSEKDNNNNNYGIIMEQAGLIKILNNLPKGRETLLGEGGKLVSGGEGQRVRYGRAMYKKNVRLVILDEPFRGLSKQERSLLLKKALEYWKTKTLIFISHDVQETINFKRVIVIENGKIIEDGNPKDLINIENSSYKSIIDNEIKVRKKILESVQWKKIRVENGCIVEKN